MSWFTRRSEAPLSPTAAAQQQAAAEARAARTPTQRFIREWILPIGVVMAIMAPFDAA